MGAKDVNARFERHIATRYAGLAERFPEPAIKHGFPYETPQTSHPFENRIAGKQAKRILMIYPWMVTGGADKVNLDWTRMLTRAGWQVSVACTLPSHNDWFDRFASITPDIFVLNTFLRQPDYGRFISYLIESRQIDLVMIYGSTFGYLSLPFLRSSHPSVAFVDLCHVEEPHWNNGGHPRFGVGYQDLLDLNIVTTSHLKHWMIERGAQSDRIHVNYTGIDTSSLVNPLEEVDGRCRALGIPPGKVIIAFAGRMCDQKRPLLLSAILGALRSRTDNFHAVVLGDGELKGAFDKDIRERGLQDMVTCLGNTGHEKWIEVLGVADIFLLPSAYEGISVALLEAMAMQAVPVTGSVGGQAEVIDSTCGFLIQPGQSELSAYVEALNRLISDKSCRTLMQQAAAHRIKTEFSQSVTDASLLCVLEKVVNQARAKPFDTIPTGFGIESLVQAVEFTRLAHATDWLWAQWIQGKNHGAATSSQPVPIPVGVITIIHALLQTRVGRWLSSSHRVRSVGRRLAAFVSR
jgi:glycosyltransferase involved in cell wall biosynthesis